MGRESFKADELEQFLADAQATLQNYPQKDREFILRRFRESPIAKGTHPERAASLEELMQRLRSWAETVRNLPNFRSFQKTVDPGKGTNDGWVHLEGFAGTHFVDFVAFPSTEGWHFWYCT